jgi:hypothetical protein
MVVLEKRTTHAADGAAEAAPVGARRKTHVPHLRISTVGEAADFCNALFQKHKHIFARVYVGHRSLQLVLHRFLASMS